MLKKVQAKRSFHTPHRNQRGSAHDCSVVGVGEPATERREQDRHDVRHNVVERNGRLRIIRNLYRPEEKRSFFGVSPVFVPSLSWLTIRFDI